MIKAENMVSISQVNQNLTKVLKLLDEHKALIVLKNNKPQYLLLDYKEVQNNSLLKECVDNIN